MENYSEKVAGLPDKSLNEYIEQRYKYIPEIVLAAIAELQKRGRVFSEEEIALIHKDIEIKEESVQKTNAQYSSTPEIPASVNPSAPELYSRQVVRVFAALFSAFFGSILMAMNLARTPGKKGIVEVLAFGFCYTCGLIWLGSRMANVGSLGLFLNIAGGYLLEFLFWDKYIGKETAYRKRSFWVPLCIALTICSLLIYLTISAE
jgi:hypothetical protein